MRRNFSTWVGVLIMALSTTQVFAEKIPFKQMIEPQKSWLVYLIPIMGLFALIVMFAKRTEQGLLKQSMLLIIDKKRVSAKTTLYLVEFHNQQFLIAENQQALALQALKNGN